MSDILLFRSKNPSIQSKFIGQLEREFTNLARLLYTTDVSNSVLEQECLPYIAKNILFKHPLQEGNGKERYRFIMKGFHNIFHCAFDKSQLNVKLNDDGKTGRCIIDSVINLKQFSWLYTYPLRCIIIFEFRLLNTQSIEEPQFEIFRHEEMWLVTFIFSLEVVFSALNFRSLADLIDAIPAIGWFYTNIFRQACRHLSIGVYTLSCYIHDKFIQSRKKKQ